MKNFHLNHKAQAAYTEIMDTINNIHFKHRAESINRIAQMTQEDVFKDVKRLNDAIAILQKQAEILQKVAVSVDK